MLTVSLLRRLSELTGEMAWGNIFIEPMLRVCPIMTTQICAPSFCKKRFRKNMLRTNASTSCAVRAPLDVVRMPLLIMTV
jgi:hypothetical protein